MITESALLPLRQRLVLERERLVSQIKMARGSVTAAEDVRDGDGMEAYEQDRAVSLAAGLRPALEEVDRALQKAEDGSYGTCDACGADIPLERLQILPQATLCVQCKSRRAKSPR